MSHAFLQGGVRADVQARDEVVTLLMDDHQQALLAFRHFERMQSAGELAACEALIRRTCALLTLHATLEEELFYPAVRRCPEIGAAERRLVHEAEVEHLVVRILMSQLRRMEADDPQFGPLVGVLGRYVAHHVKDVEQGLLPRLSHSASVDWRQLSNSLRRRRSELESQWRDELQGDAALATALRKER
ncbi:Hemerythrin HHE cation binding domain-containing protein [Roseateles sp. YR242]|uniref:hemerythrin domain-containing protein n=1 Tax=Roseateles sp. YR242 TaxID=1855305 RepID=UPI0008CA50A4|nr:hemerythrin domain-containing protein [Roseateles sp. YR242]SEL18526.1 Hemerythrin HHE cation binding domain-containing protein [Roseateles sp. YR242]